MQFISLSTLRHRIGFGAAAAIGLSFALGQTEAAFADGDPILDTTLEDFFMPGTQPETDLEIFNPIVAVSNCTLCHAGFDEVGANIEGEPFRNWVASMMGQASRDPIFYACLTVANQDAGESGDLCLRCHTPAGWLGGRSVPTDGSALTEVEDFEGVNCHFCHRLVNPTYVEGESPDIDLAILEDLALEGLLPEQPGTARYVVDPIDVRRGPFDPDKLPFNPHPPIFGFQPEILLSPFHTVSDLCATCHDVSNPALSLQKDGTYLPNNLDAPHPTMDKYEMFPLERTYSEWTESQFAAGGVVFEDGRFGGNLPDDVPIQSCQDCHMPDQQGHGCAVPGFDEYVNMPQHAFNGGNTWVLHAIRNLYPDVETGLNNENVDAAMARVQYMLRSASDMELTHADGMLNVRILNMTGHKLPTGYPEGRRAWLNVQFFNSKGRMIHEHGAYDFDTADLTTDDTKVYETRLGLDENMAAITGLPAGESQHFILNNTRMFDNRIPPIGFTNEGFAAIQAEPVGVAYADGQYWDDTEYKIPKGATEAVVTLYYQTTSKEYIEFLRDENHTDDRGQIAYDQWELTGKSAPFDMDSTLIDLTDGGILGDIDGDGIVGTTDLILLLGAWGPCDDCGACPEDLDGDCVVGTTDLILMLGNWG